MTNTRLDRYPDLTADLQRLTRTELSRPARFWHVLLLLASAAMTTVVVSLWLTEPVVRGRTAAAFAAMTIIGLGWMAFAAWVLTSKHVLLVRQRIVAGRMAISFCGLFLVGAAGVAVASGQPAAWGAAATGVLMLGIAVWVWRRAVRDVRVLTARRDTLARELGLEAP